MLQLLCVLTAFTSTADIRPPKTGEAFPAFRYPVLGEERLGAVSDYRGKKVLLIQFASW